MRIHQQIRQTFTFAIALATLSLVSIGCGEADSTNNHNSRKKYDSRERTGAICNDGSTSRATGSGACSHHDGVKYWTYK